MLGEFVSSQGKGCCNVAQGSLRVLGVCCWGFGVSSVVWVFVGAFFVFGSFVLASFVYFLYAYGRFAPFLMMHTLPPSPKKISTHLFMVVFICVRINSHRVSSHFITYLPSLTFIDYKYVQVLK